MPEKYDIIVKVLHLTKYVYTYQSCSTRSQNSPSQSIVLQHSNSNIPNLISLVNADVKYTEITSLMLNDIQIRNILINIYEGKNVKK